MKPISRVLYLGNDPDFILEFESYLKRRPSIELEIADYVYGALHSFIPENVPLIVFVDFSCLSETRKLFEELLFYKRISPFNSTLFVGLFSSKVELNQLSIIFSSGFQLSFVKGCESEMLFEDSFHLATLELNAYPDFAVARDIDKTMRVGVCSSVSSLSDTDVLVETDIEMNTDELSCALPFILGEGPRSLKILEQSSTSLVYPMTHLYRLRFPIASAWDEISANNVDPETISTWMSFNQDKMAKKYGFLKVLSTNKKLMLDLLNSHLDIPLHVDFSYELSKNWENDLISRKPALIFFDLEQTDDERFQVLDSIVRITKTIEGYSPVIIISNTETSIQSFQELLSYQLIFAFKGGLDSHRWLALTTAFLKKKGGSIVPDGIFCMELFDSRRSIDVYFGPKINSISEHFIEISSPNELPFYSVLHFSLPLDFFATIIPRKELVTKVGEYYPYTCLIHGIDEKQLTIMRQFVNQMIYSPLEDFTIESLQRAMSVPSVPVKDVEPLGHKKSAETVELPKKVSDSWIGGRLQIKGKSKL